MNLYSNGKKISVGGKNIVVSECGTGERVIIFSPGLASPSTTIEFKAVAERLTDKFRMIFVDPLGYGMSDRTDEPRKTSKVTEELHEVAVQLGINRHILAVHSLSGLAALEYSNRYTDEVEAVIGIDCVVPKQYEVRSMIEKTANSYVKRGKMKDSFVNQKVTKVVCQMLFKNCKDYKYSKEDIELYTKLSVENCDSSVTVNEINNFGENALSMRDRKFPVGIDVLFLLSNQTVKQLPNWVEWHKDVLSGNKSRIVILDGNHNLHISCANEVAANIIDFLN